MRVLLDAQLSRRLARRMKDAGYDVVHTLDLAKGNRTPDTEIIAVVYLYEPGIHNTGYWFVT